MSDPNNPAAIHAKLKDNIQMGTKVFMKDLVTLSTHTGEMCVLLNGMASTLQAMTASLHQTIQLLGVYEDASNLVLDQRERLLSTHDLRADKESS